MIYLERGAQGVREVVRDIRRSLQASVMANDLHRRLLLAESSDYYGIKLDMLRSQKLKAEYVGVDWGKVVSKAADIEYGPWPEKLGSTPREAEIAYSFYEKYLDPDEEYDWSRMMADVDNQTLIEKDNQFEPVESWRIMEVIYFLSNPSGSL